MKVVACANRFYLHFRFRVARIKLFCCSNHSGMSEEFKMPVLKAQVLFCPSSFTIVIFFIAVAIEDNALSESFIAMKFVDAQICPI